MAVEDVTVDVVEEAVVLLEKRAMVERERSCWGGIRVVDGTRSEDGAKACTLPVLSDTSKSAIVCQYR